MDKKQEKYKNAVLFFAKNLNKFQLGKTKLAKLLYYLDFISYRDKKKTVTGTLYYKQEFGPLAKDLTQIIGDLVSEKKLKVNSFVNEKDGIKKDEFIALDGYNDKVFNDYEKTLMRKLVSRYGSLSTDILVAKSHIEAPWVKAQNGGVLDFDNASDIDDFDPQAEEESQEEATKIAQAVKAELARA